MTKLPILIPATSLCCVSPAELGSVLLLVFGMANITDTQPLNMTRIPVRSVKKEAIPHSTPSIFPPNYLSFRYLTVSPVLSQYLS